MDYAALKERHRRERDNQEENLSLRIHRALSWLNRAEQCDDDDGRFIFLWIAFNAAYASEIDDNYRLSEQSTFRAFLDRLCAMDKQKQLDQLLWKEFSGSIRVLLDNPYVFQSFWDYQSGKISESDWTERFATGKNKAQKALASSDSATLLGVLFNRIYTLRNQLIHGGATWDGSVNRQQIKDCSRLMGKLVPLVIALMMDNPQRTWSKPSYPVVSG